MNKLKTFIFNGIILTLTALLMRFVEFGFGIYITKKIGSESLGIFHLILSIYLFFTTLATSGINLATIRIISEDLALNNCYNFKKPMKKCLIFSLSFGIIACTLLLVLSPFITKFFLQNQVNSSIFISMAISLPFISIASCLSGYFTALRKNGTNALNKIIEQSIKMLSTAYILSLFFPPGTNYACFSLVLGEAISEIISCIFYYFLYLNSKKNYSNTHSSKINYLNKLLKISVPIAITSYIRSFLSCLKQSLIPLRLEKSGLSRSKALSCYGIINGMAFPILLFPEVLISSFSGLLVPEFASFYAKKEFNKINTYLSKIFKLTLLFSICIIGIFLFYSNELSMFIYNNYEVSIYLKLLCPLLLFMYLDSIIDNILKGIDKQLKVMGVNILDLFISILSIFFLVPILGISGYIFTIFISELLNSCISFFQLYKFTKFNFKFMDWIVSPFIFILLSYIITEIIIINPCDNIFSFILKMLFFICNYIIFILLKHI